MPATCSTVVDPDVRGVPVTRGEQEVGDSCEVTVLIEAPGWDEVLPQAEARIGEVARGACLAALEQECPVRMASSWLEPLRRDRPALEMGVVLADDDRVARLNRDYRGREGATNVLSFASSTRDELAGGGSPGLPLPLGDVVLARETVEREAAQAGKPLDGHVLHLVVHGVLHLLGFDHHEESEAAVMEGFESRILAGFGLPDPYAGEAPGAVPHRGATVRKDERGIRK